MTECSSSDELLARAFSGEVAATGALLERYRPRLRRMLDARADPRVLARFDRSDVIQETFLEAAERLGEYQQNPEVPFFIWLRFLGLQKLMLFHRRHLKAGKRDAARDVRLVGAADPQPSSEYLAIQLLNQSKTPSRAAIQNEMKAQLMEVLDRMEPLDREVICLRHFELLNNVETAAVLGLTPSGASSRYVRALGRLKVALKEIPGFLDQL